MPKKFGFKFTIFSEADKCIWCGYAFYKDDDLKKTKEHIVPKEWGGRGRRNMAAAHRICNKERDRDVRWVPYNMPRLMPQHQKNWLMNRYGVWSILYQACKWWKGSVHKKGRDDARAS